MIEVRNNIPLIELHVSGKAFKKSSSSLPSAINILQGYEESFQFCLNQAAPKFSTTQLPHIDTAIALTATESGTLTVQTIVEALPAVVPILPGLVYYAWDLYGKVQELIKIASMFFNKHGSPIKMHIENSPGASPTIIISQDHSSVVVTPDILHAARATHKALNMISREVADDNADSILIGTPYNMAPIEINKENHHLYAMPVKTFTEDDPIKIDCSLYSLNIHSMNGRLELFDKEEIRYIPFTIKDGNVSDYIAGLDAEKTTVFALREMQTNALGEKTIKKLHLIGIEIPSN